MVQDDSEGNGKSTNLPLAETIQTLRKELQLAQQQSLNEGILFGIDKVELELKVVIGRKTSGHGGVEFYVIRAGGEHERSGETTHNVKLTLTPVTADGKRVNVSSQSDKQPSRK